MYLDGLVGLISISTLAEFLDDRVRGVKLEGLLGEHVGRHSAVAQCLCLHN